MNSAGETVHVLPSLNEDIIRHIIEIIYHAEIQPPWSRMAELAGICKLWSRQVQPLLYAHVSIQTPRQLDRFLASTTPETARGRQLGSAVRILSTTVYSTGYRTRVMSTNLPDLLSRCSALYELRLVLEDISEFGGQVIEDLKRRSPPILSLRIRDGISGGSAVRQLLQVWPSIKHLSLRSTSFAQSAPEDDEPLPPFHLYEFRWEGIRPLSIQSMLWLLNYDHGRLSGSHLRILHLSSMPENDHEGELASYYGRFLHSLRIPHPNRRILESARQLRELVLFDHKDVTRELLRSLPPEVQHIAFSIQDFPSDAVENILMMRDKRFLPNLRVVSVYRETIKPWPPYWERLVARTAAIGIQLVRQEHRGLLVGGSEDLIATASYPRPVTIRQFDRMSAAVDTLPTIYTKTDGSEQGPILLAPPERSRESLSQHSGNSGSRHSLSAQGQRTIHLDEPSYAPRQWDYVYDRPLELIKLDDPVDLLSNHPSRWGALRRSISAFKTRVSEGRSKQSLDAGR